MDERQKTTVSARQNLDKIYNRRKSSLKFLWPNKKFYNENLLMYIYLEL